MFIKSIESRTNSQTKFKSHLRQKHFNHIFCSSLLLMHKGEEEFPNSGWVWHRKCQKHKDHPSCLNSPDWKGAAFLGISPKRCKLLQYFIMDLLYQVSATHSTKELKIQHNITLTTLHKTQGNRTRFETQLSLHAVLPMLHLHFLHNFWLKQREIIHLV